MWWKLRSRLMAFLARLTSSDTADVAARNPNVGQFTVAPTGKFLHVTPISLPSPNEADDR